MHTSTGIIQVIRMLEDGEPAAGIEFSSGLIPNPGKYFLAYQADDPNVVLGWPLFPVGLTLPDVGSHYNGPLLGSIPKSWNPGTQLQIRGPLGHGFTIPPNTRRLALAAFGNTASRLLPLIQPALENGINISIFTSSPLPPLPTAIEIQALHDLKDNLAWADFLALDIPLDQLPDLRVQLGLDFGDRLPCQAQALITTPMPCAGIGDCGACAVLKPRGGFQLACKDGPVFDLKDVDW